MESGERFTINRLFNNMKGKSIFSIVALLVLLAAVIMFLNEMVDLDDMDGGDWTIVLIVVGVLLGIGALLINSITKNNEQGNTTSILTGKTNPNVLSDMDSSPSTKTKMNLDSDEVFYNLEFIKSLYDSGSIGYSEYSMVEKSLSLIKAGLLSNEQFLNDLPEVIRLKVAELRQQQIASEEEYKEKHETLLKLQELRASGVLTEEEFKTEKRKLYSK